MIVALILTDAGQVEFTLEMKEGLMLEICTCHPPD